MGHGRQAALGDAICNLFATQGAQVWREFYYNDAGVQIQTLAASTQARAKGIKPGDAAWPESAYNGDYIADIAADFLAKKTVSADDREFTASGDVEDMEPAGVGARNLAECLGLQLLDCKDCEETRAAIAVCKQPMELLAKRDVKRLSHLCGFTEVAIKGAISMIGRLDPKPGRRFVNVERNLIVPDVIVVKSGRGFKVTLNGDVMPRLRVHDIYANALKQHKGQDGQALQQRLQEARWFIKNIQQRFDTILRVSSAIVERQKNFFTHGELAMYNNRTRDQWDRRLRHTAHS